MIAPRLFPDMAATPTARERSEIRAHWDSLAPTLFEQEAAPTEPSCAVCGSTEHTTDGCPHGTAPTLPEYSEHADQPDRYRDGFTPHE